MITLIIIQQRNLIDISAKNNLLTYATGSYLDHLGALLGVTRLTPASASCTVKFTLSAPLTSTALIPQGTRLTPGDNLYFATSKALTIPAGETTASCIATCTTPGISGNGYLPGQVSRLVDVFPYAMAAVNLTETAGGTDTESDEAFRERIHIAPESFSSAGPVKSYEYYAKSANPDIIAVSVMGPPDTQPGHVNIYPLMSGGVLPSDEVIAAVDASCSADDVRPDTDYVHVLKPQAITYNVNVKYWIDAKNSSLAGNIKNAVELAVNDWVKWQKSDLGRDINPSELSRRILDAGAKRCEITSPAFQVLAKNQVAFAGNIAVNFGGLEEG